MARGKIVAPANPETTRAARTKTLREKGSKRTPAESAELLDLLAARVEALEARLAGNGAG